MEENNIPQTNTTETNENNFQFESRLDLSKLQESVYLIKQELGKVLVGQKNMVDLLMKCYLMPTYVFEIIECLKIYCSLF